MRRPKSNSPSAPIIEFPKLEAPVVEAPFNAITPKVADADYVRTGGKSTSRVDRLREGNVSCYCVAGLSSATKGTVNQNSIYVNRVTTSTIDFVVAEGLVGNRGGLNATRICVNTLHRHRAWGIPMEDGAREISPGLDIAWKKGVGAGNMGCTYAAVSIDEELGSLHCVHAGVVRVLVVDQKKGVPYWLSREHTIERMRRDQGQAVGTGERNVLHNYASVGSTSQPRVNHGDYFQNNERILPHPGEWDKDCRDVDIPLGPGQRVIIANYALMAAIPPARIAHASRAVPDGHDFLRNLKAEMERLVSTKVVSDSSLVIAVYDHSGRKIKDS